jgi:hypothetical protein
LAFAWPVQNATAPLKAWRAQPMPMHMPGSGVGIAPARYDHLDARLRLAIVCGYPNYAAVTYPKQYRLPPALHRTVHLSEVPLAGGK